MHNVMAGTVFRNSHPVTYLLMACRGQNEAQAYALDLNFASAQGNEAARALVFGESGLGPDLLGKFTQSVTEA